MKLSKKNKNIVIRGAESYQDFMITVKNAGEVFGIGSEPFIASNVKYPGFALENTRLVEINGKVVASLDIQTRNILLKNGVVRAGCVADVNTLPQYRTQGIGTLLLDEAAKYMEKRGDDISLLFASRHSFYGRLGWKSIPRAKYYIESERAGFPVPERYHVREVDSKTASKIMKRIYMNSSADYIGGVVRSDEYWKTFPDWYSARNATFIIADEGETPVAACVIVKYKNCMRIFECVNLRGHDEAPKNLLNKALEITKSNKSGFLFGTLPETHPMAVKIMLLGGIKTVDNELMLKVINHKKIKSMLGDYAGKKKTDSDESEKIEYLVMRALMGYSGFNERTVVFDDEDVKMRSSKDMSYWDSDKF